MKKEFCIFFIVYPITTTFLKVAPFPANTLKNRSSKIWLRIILFI